MKAGTRFDVQEEMAQLRKLIAEHAAKLDLDQLRTAQTYLLGMVGRKQVRDVPGPAGN